MSCPISIVCPVPAADFESAEEEEDDEDEVDCLPELSGRVSPRPSSAYLPRILSSHAERSACISSRWRSRIRRYSRSEILRTGERERKKSTRRVDKVGKSEVELEVEVESGVDGVDGVDVDVDVDDKVDPVNVVSATELVCSDDPAIIPTPPVCICPTSASSSCALRSDERRASNSNLATLILLTTY